VNRVRERFTHSDLQYLRLIVSQVGPLIENYRLLKRMQTLSVLEEKNRIARDLHDGLVQSLASLDLRIEVCRKLSCESSQELRNELRELQRIVRSEHSELRNYMKRLRTPCVASHKLAEALKGYVQEFERQNGLEVSLCIEPEELDLPRQVSSEIYQIIHEGLTNIKKHAAARQVLIKLNRDDTTANLMISDDGCGFPRKVGLSGKPISGQPWSIYERTRALSGTLEVDSSPGKGSSLHIRIPIAVEQDA